MTTGYRVRLDLDLNAADRLIDEAGSDALMAVALDGEAYAKRNIRGGGVSHPGLFPGVDTGVLKGGIHASPTDDPLCKRLDSSADYGPYLEWGTRHMAARPFMKPTMRYMWRVGPDIAADVMGRRLA